MNTTWVNERVKIARNTVIAFDWHLLTILNKIHDADVLERDTWAPPVRYGHGNT